MKTGGLSGAHSKGTRRVETQGKTWGRERLRGRPCERKSEREKEKEKRKRKIKTVTRRKRVGLSVGAGCRVDDRVDEGWIKRVANNRVGEKGKKGDGKKGRKSYKWW